MPKSFKMCRILLFHSYGQYSMYFNCFVKKKAIKFKKNCQKIVFGHIANFAIFFKSQKKW